MDGSAFLGATFINHQAGVSTIKIYSGDKPEVVYQMAQDKYNGHEYLFLRYAEMNRHEFCKIVKTNILAYRRARIDHVNKVMSNNRDDANRKLFLEILTFNSMNPFNQRCYIKERYTGKRMNRSVVKITITPPAITYEYSPYMAFEEILGVILKTVDGIGIHV